MKYPLLLTLLSVALFAHAQTNLDSLRSKDVAYQLVVINGVEHKNDGVNAYIEPPDPKWEFGLTDIRKLQADLKLLHSYDEVYNYMVQHRWQYLDKTTSEITSLTEFEVKFRKANPYFVDPYAQVARPAEPKTKKQKQAEEKAKTTKAKKEKEPAEPKVKKPKRKFRVTDG